jgi:hypothetical protein
MVALSAISPVFIRCCSYKILNISRRKMEAEYTIAPAKPDEFAMIETIQYNLGWDPFKNSYQVIKELSPGGVFFGKLAGKIISSIIAMKYSEQFGFIGVYWVKKEHRGNGRGYQIFVKAMEYLSGCEILALDAVDDQVKNYEKWGFQVACNSIKRMTRVVPAVDALRTTTVLSEGKASLERVIAFQEKMLPALTGRHLKSSFSIGIPFMSIDKTTNEVRGYCIATKCHSGYAIAPLIAETDEVAVDLIKEVFSHFTRHGKKDVRLLVFTQDEFFKVRTLMA